MKVKLNSPELTEADLRCRLPKGMKACKPQPLHTLRLQAYGARRPQVNELTAHDPWDQYLVKTPILGRQDVESSSPSEWLFDLWHTGYYAIEDPGERFRCIEVTGRATWEPISYSTVKRVFLHSPDKD